MNEWKEYKLKDIGCSFLSGFAFKSINYLNEGIPIIKIGNIQNRTVLIEVNGNFVSKELINEKTSKYLLKNRDVLIAMTGQGSVGRVGRIKIRNTDSAFLNQRVGKFICDEKRINIDYLFYVLSSEKYQEALFNAGSGSGQPNLSPELILDFEIPAPEYSEQKSIAEVLSSIDDKIDLLQCQNKTLEQLAETLFRQWFVEEAEEGWEESKLSELLTITSSKRIYYSEYTSSGIPFYRSKEIIELHNSGSTNSELFISIERFQDIEKKFGTPVKGDILMTSVGTLGVTYRVKEEDKFYFKDGNLTWFKDFKGIPSPIIYLWLNSRIGQEELRAITIGSTQEALTIVGLKNLSFKVPPKNKLKLYEQEFEIIVNKIEFNQNQIRTLTQLRDTLLPKLMSGEVRAGN